MLSASASHQGFVRGNNEDRVYTDDQRGIYAVVDGMGGHNAGEEAAQIAIEQIRKRLERQTGSLEQRIREAIALANNAIYQAAQSNGQWKGMACVLTVAVVEKSRAVVGHVGDSRLYEIRGGLIRKITRDHSPVGEREDSGEISEAEAMRHPRRNEVFRDVGSQERTPDDEDFIDIYSIPFEPDGALVLCSDGLSDVVPSTRILRIVEENSADRFAAVRALIDAANENSKDNVSVVIVQGPAFARQRDENTARLKPRSRRTWLVAAACAIVGATIPLAVEYFTGTGPFEPKQPVVPPPRVLTVSPAGAQFATIGAALEQARKGDTVVVDAGEYREIVHLKDGVAIRAASPRSPIVGGISAVGAIEARAAGLTVRGPVAVRDANADLEQLDVSGSSGPGVEFAGAARGRLVASQIHGNAGPGVLVRDGAAPLIEHNWILGNGRAPASPQPGIQIISALRPTVAANLIAENGAEPVWIAGNPDPALAERNQFSINGKPAPRRPVRVLTPEAHRP